MKRPAAVILPCLLLAASSSAEDWPGWRGPRGDGTSAEKNVPLEWSATKNIAWKTAIPGIGHSSPIVFGDRVFVTSCVDKDPLGKDINGDRILVCLDRRNGKVLWQKTVLTAKLEGKHGHNSRASSTPATDGKHVYVTFLDYPNMVVVCYDFEGKEIWRRSPGMLKSVHGFCTSPVLYKNMVILNGDQDDPSAYIVALDKDSGKEIWRTSRQNPNNPPNRKGIRSYCTPILVRTTREPEVTQLVLSGNNMVTGYNADTGELLWVNQGPTEQYVASLVYHDDVLCLTTGFPEYHLMGLSPHGRGDITNTKYVVWHIPHDKKLNGKNAAYVTSPIAAHGLFFICSDVGMLSCVEAKTRNRLYMHQLGKHHYCSPVLVDDHMLFFDDDGTCWVVKPGRTFELVRKNELGEKSYSSPAVSHEALFVRTEGHLWCIGK
jgi:outer membrane protein assembly factor BamB